MLFIMLENGEVHENILGALFLSVGNLTLSPLSGKERRNSIDINPIPESKKLNGLSELNAALMKSMASPPNELNSKFPSSIIMGNSKFSSDVIGNSQLSNDVTGSSKVSSDARQRVAGALEDNVDTVSTLSSNRLAGSTSSGNSTEKANTSDSSSSNSKYTSK